MRSWHESNETPRRKKHGPALQWVDPPHCSALLLLMMTPIDDDNDNDAMRNVMGGGGGGRIYARPTADLLDVFALLT